MDSAKNAVHTCVCPRLFMQRPPGAFAKHVWPLRVRQDSKPPECACCLLSLKGVLWNFSLPATMEAGNGRNGKQRLGNVALHCSLCSVSARLILCPHPSPPAARRRTQPNTRSGCPSKGAREGGSAFARSSPRRRVRQARAFFAPENPAFLSKNRFFAVSAPTNPRDFSENRSDCPKTPVFTV